MGIRGTPNAHPSSSKQADMNHEQTPLFEDSQQPELPVKTDRPHLATVSHDGLFWDVYVDFQHQPSSPASHRAALLFSPAGGPSSGHEAVSTAVILIEESDDAVIRRAQTFGEHQLAALLRSVL